MYFRTGYHYNKEAVRDKYVLVHYCPTDINIIDAGTKALGPIKIEGFEPQLHGFKPLPEVPDEWEWHRGYSGVKLSSMVAFKNAGNHAPVLNHMSLGLALRGEVFTVNESVTLTLVL